MSRRITSLMRYEMIHDNMALWGNSCDCFCCGGSRFTNSVWYSPRITNMNFGTGLGIGLGMAFGGILSSIFGGGFGGFNSFGMPGFGGFGMPGLGFNSWGGSVGSSSGSSKSDKSDKADKDDKPKKADETEISGKQIKKMKKKDLENLEVYQVAKLNADQAKALLEQAKNKKADLKPGVKAELEGIIAKENDKALEEQRKAEEARKKQEALNKTVDIDGTNKKITELTVDDINKLTKGQIEQIVPAQVENWDEEKARALLDIAKATGAALNPEVERTLTEICGKAKAEAAQKAKADADKADAADQNNNSANVNDWSKLSGVTLSDADKAALDKAGKLVNNIYGADKWFFKPTKELDKATLDLLSNNNIPLAAANNPNAKDKWIAGTVSNVEETNGKLSYEIDCKGYGMFGLKFKIAQKDTNTANITCISPDKDLKRYKVEKNGLDYQFDSEGYLKYTTDNRILVKVKQASGSRGRNNSSGRSSSSHRT